MNPALPPAGGAVVCTAVLLRYVLAEGAGWPAGVLVALILLQALVAGLLATRRPPGGNG